MDPLKIFKGAFFPAFSASLAPQQKNAMFSGTRPPKACIAISKNRVSKIFRFQRPYRMGKPIHETPPTFIILQWAASQIRKRRFFRIVFFRDISPQILTPCRLFNCKIKLRIFEHRLYVAETRKYTEIRLVLSLGCLQLCDFIESHVVKSVAGYKL